MTDHSLNIVVAMAAGDYDAWVTAVYYALRDEEYMAKMREACAQGE